MQQIDPKNNEILTTLNNVDSASTHLAKQAESYCIKNSMLYNISNPHFPRLYVPAALIKAVIYHHHDTSMMSHLGHRRTLDKIKQTFFWPKMSRDVFGTLKSMIKAYTTDDQSTWDQNLYMHVFAYCTAKHETLGISPFEALYGRQPRLPAATLKPTNPNIPNNIIRYERRLQSKLTPIRAIIQHNNNIAKKAMQLRYNARHRATTYQIGDYVLLKRQTADGLDQFLGLSSAYIGPYQVIDKIGRFSYLLEYMDEDGYKSRTTAHINRLKPFHGRITAETFSMGREDDVTPGIGTSQS
ncbi:Transposon Ty3-I Gag-Pol polyprotein [Smittium culicis]|uniref:Transposon Ty3-I Gag-Pol polyprotein n=1 Tax=Smittium culicis TaxID=133412 RepID=A0A1R1X4U6_9FUNG|nr:Transposon Ty3-I Gag-Pol polyprotein [Smittium culicis]